MSPAAGPSPQGNPFSTRRVRPGAVPYRFPEGQNVERLVARLEEEGWWGQILGAHGSGKSALLATLRAAMGQRGRKVLLVELHDGQRRLAQEVRAAVETGKADVVVVDGYEQLGWLARFTLKRLCRRRGAGLVVTAHRSVGLPALFHTKVDAETARDLVASLEPNGQPSITPEEVDACWLRHEGNLRDVFFELYDRYEQRHRNKSCDPDRRCDRQEREP